MKIVKKVNEDIENLMKDNNRNLEEPKNAVTALSPAFQQAVEENEKIEKKMGDDLKELSDKGKEIALDSPDTGKKVKTAYTEQLTLDESLFEEYGSYKGELYLDQDDEEEFSVEEDEVDESMNEAKKKIEDLPDTIWELAYDRMFPAAVKNYKPTILSDNPIAFEDNRIYMSDYVGFEDIGAVVQNEEEANFVKDVATFVGAEYKFIPAEKIPGGVKGIGAAIVHFKDEDEANTPTDKYLKKIGFEGAVRKDPNAYKKDKKDEQLTLDEEAKITITVYDYEPWSGAVETFEKIREEDKLEELDMFLEEMYPDGLTDTELNDLLWFEPEYVFEALGIETES